MGKRLTFCWQKRKYHSRLQLRNYRRHLKRFTYTRSNAPLMITECGGCGTPGGICSARPNDVQSGRLDFCSTLYQDKVEYKKDYRNIGTLNHKLQSGIKICLYNFQVLLSKRLIIVNKQHFYVLFPWWKRTKKSSLPDWTSFGRAKRSLSRAFRGPPHLVRQQQAYLPLQTNAQCCGL